MIRILITSCLALVLGVNAFGQCNAPHYRKGRDFVDPKLGRGAVYVSIKPSDFTLDKLTCLGQALKKRHPEWKSVAVLIFSSHDAAMYFRPTPLEIPQYWWALWASHYYASYELRAEDESLEIMPLGLVGDGSADSKLDLPLEGSPKCTQAVANRCLMAVLKQVAYPEEALKAKVSGAVTVAGSIVRDGSILSVAVDQANVTPPDRKDLLGGEPLANVKTWRFDAAQGQNSFRITFT